MKHILADIILVLFITGIVGCMNNSRDKGADRNAIDTNKPIQNNIPKDTPNRADRTMHPPTADSIGTNKMK